MGNAKLHQLLAVESDLEGKYKRVCEESKKVFNKPAMFMGYHRSLVSFLEDDPIEYPDENQAMATTVEDRVNYTGESIASYLDALYQKEATNQNAKADLVVDGVTIGTNLPATFLLALESRLKYIRSVYETIPTLPAGVEWKPSEDKGEGVWDMVHPEEKLKTKMTFKSKVLVEAQFPPEGRSGQSLPAQIEKWEEQVPVGKFVKNVWCSMITSHEKAEVLGRIDKLIQAVKRQRQQANTEPVVKGNVGAAIVNFINGG
ncbi:MAG: hypothetical protein DRO67_00490 [Candidatus Asgardarchaeum californiense]|nr:MAG: hypothetical protein DRO67_00490 [Candidatus Asgardarchaeum californiense]